MSEHRPTSVDVTWGRGLYWGPASGGHRRLGDWATGRLGRNSSRLLREIGLFWRFLCMRMRLSKPGPTLYLDWTPQ
jgi:hypothetical protein